MNWYDESKKLLDEWGLQIPGIEVVEATKSLSTNSDSWFWFLEVTNYF